MTRPRRLWLAVSGLVATALLLTLLLGPGTRYLRAVAVLLAITQAPDPSGLTSLVTGEIAEQVAALTLPHRTLRMRRFAPAGRDDPPRALLLHGVHPAGIDEPRLQAFARALARVGIEVTTPELPELAGYRIVPTTIDDIRACADRLRGPDGAPVGAIGISFAGGLSLLAAADDAGASRFDYVLAVGAHHSLERLATFYAGRPVHGPNGEPAAGKAHPYGARVITYAHAERFFDATDLPHARAALRLYLSERYREARRRMERLTPAGRARMELVLDATRHAELGTLLLDAVARERAALAAVSPAGKLGELDVATYLIHGTADPVIPSIETAWLAQELPARARREVLITPVLGHADLSSSLPASAYARIVRFMARVLAEADD